MVISKELLEEIPQFENFLHKIGFKRIEGTVYGLLVLSDRPLTSEEIESTLNLSQSAVSQALKVLTHYGAVETTTHATERRTKLHTAKEDSLSIVASVFRKREQETIEEFKAMAHRVRTHANDADGVLSKRMNSIISTCEIAESVMDFVIQMAQKKMYQESPQIIKRIPKALELVMATTEPLGQIKEGLKSTLSNTLKSKINKLTGDQHAK